MEEAMNDDTVKRTIRVEKSVDAALVAQAALESKDPSEYITDLLSRHAIDLGVLAAADAKRVENEIEIKRRARDRAREICAKQFDPDVTLKVFQEFRAEPEFNAMYCAAIGGDPMTRGNHTQARINRSLGSIIKRAVNGEAETTPSGHRINATVSDEYIRSYTPLRPATENSMIKGGRK